MDELASAYWQAYLDTLPTDAPRRRAEVCSEGWGDSPEMAEELGQLIATGKKTATCSALWSWEEEGNEPTSVGLCTVVLDGQNKPLCIVETTEVTIRTYEEVDEQFAHDEGEGDLTLGYWRAAHWRFFTRQLAPIGKEPTMDMPLVCERFRVVYPDPTATFRNL